MDNVVQSISFPSALAFEPCPFSWYDLDAFSKQASAFCIVASFASSSKDNNALLTFVSPPVLSHHLPGRSTTCLIEDGMSTHRRILQNGEQNGLFSRLIYMAMRRIVFQIETRMPYSSLEARISSSTSGCLPDITSLLSARKASMPACTPVITVESVSAWGMLSTHRRSLQRGKEAIQHVRTESRKPLRCRNLFGLSALFSDSRGPLGGNSRFVGISESPQ